MLAQLDRDEALAKGYWNLSMIVLIGLLAILFLVVMFLLRRWKRRQLKAIDADRHARRAGQSIERVDAWAAGSERYVDHDKLTSDDDFKQENLPDDERYEEEDEEAIPGSEIGDVDEAEGQDEDDRDPYGLFSDKPYQDSDDEDDLEDDDEDGWDDEENKF